ncbi:uncharacterized protein F5891DRAFT_1003014 [Suillus fuscotomentosus]|uniref:RING-type domain-containing protein n=1 Tax=Suillus fuscotomentosus TaxID=1912939 RepID=A0AAD4HT98_9AGAM|nr:uncharacterized protein F5891DRAFT_1003014 [Suillus fuscotomentosus]KAG1906614.1 hypothetical protein F5891DRAFT_1003014 [Suillus fuscotomentosus]
MEELQPSHSDTSVSMMGLSMSRSGGTSSSALKRGPSSSFEGLEDETSKKRFKEDLGNGPDIEKSVAKPYYEALAEDLAQELQCGCCTELVYRPVVVSPCQHFFCGSCCVLWIRNGGTNCPACRGVSTIVTPSRPLQSIVDILLRADPSRERAERERIQADEVYKAGCSMRIPTPREASPEPNLNQNADYVRPCPHCAPDNAFGWRCPQPVIDYGVDPERAWHLDDGNPPGHAFCGNCENLLALRAPSTTKCDLCQVSFCGVGVPGRCLAAPLLSQHPHNMSDLGDLIQSSEVYGCFDHNTVEVDIMLDYLTAQEISPRHIYREVASHILSQPNGFRPLIELDLFVDIHSVTAGIDENPDAPRNRICRQCATEVMLWGIKDWWIRERQKGFLQETVTRRPDCKEGTSCSRQKDLAHAREYNHIIAPRFSGDSVFSTEASMTGTQGSPPVFAAITADAARQLEPEMAESRGNATVTDLPTNSFLIDGL